MVMLLRMADLFDLLLSYILSPEGRCIALVGFFENQSKSNIFIKEITFKFFVGLKKLGKLRVQIKKSKAPSWYKISLKVTYFVKKTPVNFTGNSLVNFTGISSVKLKAISN